MAAVSSPAEAETETTETETETRGGSSSRPSSAEEGVAALVHRETVAF